jgi:methylase of polypeptide subunit release factors
LAGDLSRLVSSGGIAVVEMGQSQAATVASLMAGAGLSVRETRRDLSGIERVLVLARR